MVTTRDAGFALGVNGAKHHCCVFSTDEQFIKAAVDFLRTGLDAGERLLYVADAPDAGSLLQALAPLGDVERLAADGGLVVQPVWDAYAGVVIKAEAQVAAYKSLSDQAVALGFTGLCVAADATTLVVGEDVRRDFMAYELAIDRYIADAPMRAMCAYDVRVLGQAVLDLVCVHRHQRVPKDLDPGFTMWNGDACMGLAGEVDMSNTVRFRTALEAAYDALPLPVGRGAGGEPLLIDAANLDFIDAEGASALLSFAERFAPRHAVVVADPPRSLEAVVHTLGWTDRIVLSRRGDEA